MQAQMQAQAEAHRRELQAYHEWDAQRAADMGTFFSSLNIPGVVVPPSLLSPFVHTPTLLGIGTPVSIYAWLFIILASAVVLQVLMNLLLVCAGKLRGFGADSGGWPVATVPMAHWWPSPALRVDRWPFASPTARCARSSSGR